MEILDGRSITRKIKRLALQILEHQVDDKPIFLAGINNNGHRLAALLQVEIQANSALECNLFRIRVHASNPISAEVEAEIDMQSLTDQCVVIVDDVANTGRTLFYAFKPFMQIIPRSITCAVLVDRQHKNFPVQVNYFGLSLATTMKDNILVKLEGQPYSAELV